MHMKVRSKDKNILVSTRFSLVYKLFTKTIFHCHCLFQLYQIFTLFHSDHFTPHNGSPPPGTTSTASPATCRPCYLSASRLNTVAAHVNHFDRIFFIHSCISIPEHPPPPMTCIVPTLCLFVSYC